jgi:hypothetical protein
VLDFAWANPSTARAQVQGGKMKVLGIAGTRRVSTMPTVPTFTEQGFQGFDVDSWIGLYRAGQTARRHPGLPGSRPCARSPPCPTCRPPDRLSALSRWATRPRSSCRSSPPTIPRVAELIKAAGVTPQQ